MDTRSVPGSSAASLISKYLPVAVGAGQQSPTQLALLLPPAPGDRQAVPEEQMGPWEVPCSLQYRGAAETPHQVPASRSQRRFCPGSAPPRVPSLLGPWGRHRVEEGFSGSPPPTSSSLPVSFPTCLPHQLTVLRLGAMPPGREVDSPGGISGPCQQVGAATQEAVVAPIKGSVVEA